MKRSIIFTEPQMKWLEKEAAKLGVSVAELVRRIIDEKRDANMR